MRKRRNRQPDIMDDGSEDSSESGEKANSGSICPHVSKASNTAKVISVLKKTGIGTECGSCKKLGCDEAPADEEGFSTMPAPLWICLRCGHQACGRNQKAHAQAHFKTPRSDCHCLAVDTHLWSIWCYQCKTEVQADCRKQLLKLVEFSKKIALSSTPVVKQAIPLPSIQMDNSTIRNTEDKQKIPLNGLTTVVGLANLGNTCFLNAVLQCLSQTPFLVKVLEDLEEAGEKFILPGGKFKITEESEESEVPPIEGSLDGWGNFTAILCRTLKDMQSTKVNTTYVPQELLSAFRKETAQCMDGGQHDSHELLRHLLELVRTEDLRRYQTIILNEAGIKSKKSQKTLDDTMKANIKFYGRQASARLLGPEPVFRGVLVSTLECLECHHSSQRTEPFLDLSLPVMADKPQPPVLKRKNSGFDDSFDSMGNNISSTPSSKHQSKKEDSERRRRQLRRRSLELNNASPSNRGMILFGNTNSISEENQTGAAESESDADIEDNISAPEVIESGYSSEKVSAVASPVSPMNPDLSNNSVNSSDMNGGSMNGNLPASPIESADSAAIGNNENKTKFSQRSLMDVTINLNEVAMQSSDTSSAESPTRNSHSGAGNETGECQSLSTSLIVTSEMGPEVATISPLSSPITSKDSPMSPPSSMTDAENPQAEMNELRLIIENSSNKSVAADIETSENQTPKKTEDKSVQNSNSLPVAKTDNGMADITVGLSKVAVTGHSQPARYHTKEGDCSIQSCLNQFTALELMTGSNKVGCEACTDRENKGKEGSTKMVCTPSTKQYLISRVPAVLILHLKRFQSQRMAGFRKVAKHVTFPMLLDLAPVCKGDGKSKLYSLYGVVEHSGTLHGGHYVAYVKTRPPLTVEDPRWTFLPSKDSKESAENSSASSSDSEGDEKKASLSTEPPPGRWYYISDSRVNEVDEATVLQSQAYILFYERIL